MDRHDQFHADLPDSSPTSPAASQSLPRRLAANWWRILLAWVVVSVPLAFLLNHWIEPTFRAVSSVRVENSQPELFGPSMWNQEVTGAQGSNYLFTEMENIKSNRTLESALAGRLGGSQTLSMLRNAEDPVEDLRKRLEVSIIPNTHFIEVALETKDPAEGAKIVNTIVDTYRQHTQDMGSRSSKHLFEDLIQYKKSMDEEIQKTKAKILEIADQPTKPARPVVRRASPTRRLSKPIS